MTWDYAWLRTRGVLPRAPAALRQAGPGRHRATDRYLPGPHPGAPLPQGPDGAALAQDRGDPRPAQEDGRGARPGASRLPRAEAGTEAEAGLPGPEAGVLRGR